MTSPKKPGAARGRRGRGPGSHGGSARWPTVDEQLSAARVTPGSALEGLIRNNQDLEMLRPEEAADKVQLPPWIRIAWRKRHPEGEYTGPSGGYPLVLARIHEWMLTHHDLPGYEDPNTAGSGRGEHHGQ
jgi:hypothetical protein